MKVLSLHQPWATLIALGVKTIETRGHNTNVRGRIAIHAAARKPDVDGAQQIRQIGDWWAEADGLGAFTIHHCEDLHVDHPLPLGAIVATATLVKCVPMFHIMQAIAYDVPYPNIQINGTDSLGYAGATEHDSRRIEDQLPYGDFRPGRWGWLLEDIEPLRQPVPFKGGQGWSKNWEPAT